jgi:hypothetical protein
VGARHGLAALASALVLAGCGGGDETEFDAEGFVDALNAGGAGLELGDELANTQEGVEVRAVKVTRAGGGSIVVAADEEAGRAEHARCEAAVTLLCYRAANVVLLLEDELAPPERMRLEAAFTALAED